MHRITVSLLAAAAALVAGATAPLSARAADIVVSCQTEAPAGAEVPATPAVPDEVTGEGATACAAGDAGSPTAAVAVSGSIRLELWLEELNPSTGAAQFVRYASTAPQPLIGGEGVAAGAAADLRQGVPAAGQTDPGTGWTSLGQAEYYAGVPLAVDGAPQATGLACESNDFSCSRSESFPIL